MLLHARKHRAVWLAVGSIASLLCIAARSASAAPLPNPCALITTAQVSGILDSKIVSTTPTGNKLYRSCVWTAKNLAPADAEPVQRTLRIQIVHSTKAAFLQQADHQPNAKRVDGIGQIAWTLRPTNFLNVYTDGLALQLISGFTASPLSAEKTAATIALKHL